jgi:hypothetical protein
MASIIANGRTWYAGPAWLCLFMTQKPRPTPTARMLISMKAHTYGLVNASRAFGVCMAPRQVREHGLLRPDGEPERRAAS